MNTLPLSVLYKASCRGVRLERGLKSSVKDDLGV